MSGRIVIVSGPPGGGKTTLARRLAEGAAGPAVHLHTDDFYAAIKHGYILPWLEESHAQNTTVTRAIAAAAVAYAQGGYEVLLDGIVGPWFLPLYREAAAAAGLSLDLLYLRPDRAVAARRVASRDDSPLPDYPPGLYESFADLGPLEPHVIDTTKIELDALTGQVRAGLAEGRFRLA